MMTNEEKLELAKKCGAKVVYEGAQYTIFFESQLDLFSYASAIEEKHQAEISLLRADGGKMAQHEDAVEGEIASLKAQIAMLVNKAQQLLNNSEEYEFDDGTGRGADNTFWNELEEAITATQATADAFVAEIEVGVLEELYRRYYEANGHLSLAVISTAMLGERNSLIIEKRKQAEQGKENRK